MEITDPTLVFLLVTLGLVGLGVESLTPGGIVPAVVGLVALVFGVVGMVAIGPDPVGLGLLIASVVAFISAVAFRLYRPLSVVATLFLIGGGIWLFNRSEDPTSIPVDVIASILVGILMAFVIERASAARGQKVRYGPEDLAGMTGDVRSPLRPEGQVFVDGGLWRAELEDPDGSVSIGEKVEVVEVRGLTMVVRPLGQGPGKRVSGQNPEETEVSQ